MESHGLVGRDNVLAQLAEFVTSTTDHSAALVGVAGTGLTTLLLATERMAADAGTRVVRIDAREGSHAALTAVAAELRDSADPVPVQPTRCGDDSDATDITSRQMLLSLARTTRSDRLMICLDDADRLDDAAAQTLSYLSRRLAGTGVKLVTACSPGAVGLPRHAVDVALPITSLDGHASDLFLRQHFPTIDAPTRRSITRRSDGLPRELVRAGYLAIAATSSATVGSEHAGVGLRNDGSPDLLQRCAAQALRHGDSHTAAKTFRLSAASTVDPAAKARRLAAASALVSAANADIPTATSLLEQALRVDPSATRSLEAVVARSYLSAKAPESIREAQRTFATAIRAHPPGPGDRMLDDALWSLLQLCHLGDRPEFWADFAALVAQHEAVAPEWARVAAQMCSSSPASADPLDNWLDRLIATLQHTADAADIVRSAFVATSRSSSYWWRAALHRVWSDPRSSVTSSVCAAWMLGSHYLGAGRWDEAQRILDDGMALCAASGLQLYAHAYLARSRHLLAAYRGELDIALLTSTAPGWMANGVGVMRHRNLLYAAAAIGTGNPRRALRLLRAGKDGPVDIIARGDRGMIDLAEAARETGSQSATRAILAGLSDVADTADPRLSFLRLCSSAILTDDSEVAARAVGTPGADRWPFDLARVRLHLGHRLRMSGDVRAAREQLHQALSTFTVLGAGHWSARASGELRLLGEPVAAISSVGSSPQISATARRIAEMAVSGMSNRAIASRMGISPSTVSSHLSHVYRAVGVRSRTALLDCAVFA